jgi:hypothetical protein
MGGKRKSNLWPTTMIYRILELTLNLSTATMTLS